MYEQIVFLRVRLDVAQALLYVMYVHMYVCVTVFVYAQHTHTQTQAGLLCGVETLEARLFDIKTPQKRNKPTRKHHKKLSFQYLFELNNSRASV